MGFINQLITGGHHPVGGLPCSDPLIVESQILNVGITVNFQFLTHTTLPITIQNAMAITAMGHSWYLLFNFAKMISIWSSNFAILIIFGTEVSNFALCKIFNNLSFQNSKWIGTWTTLPSWWQVPAAGTCYLKGFKWATLEPFIIPVAPKSW